MPMIDPLDADLSKVTASLVRDARSCFAAPTSSHPP